MSEAVNIEVLADHSYNSCTSAAGGSEGMANGPMPSHRPHHAGHKADGSNNHRGYDSHQGKGPRHPSKPLSLAHA